ncbi:hypothetical protein M2421_004156 [Stenotrophomonas sp. BIGb0135]|nr:hypothetical protein [Stenotrophomonas sp. BIGb0135]
MARSAPGIASACSRLGRAEPCSAAFPTPLHNPHRCGAEHGSALPGRRKCVHLRRLTWLGTVPVSVPRVPASVEPSHARLLSQHLCMSPTATVPSMARHYLTAGNALTCVAEHGSALPDRGKCTHLARHGRFPSPSILPATASTHAPLIPIPCKHGLAHPCHAITGPRDIYRLLTRYRRPITCGAPNKKRRPKAPFRVQPDNREPLRGPVLPVPGQRPCPSSSRRAPP